MTDHIRKPPDVEERAQKGVDLRPVTKVTPADMPHPSGLVPQQSAPATNERPPRKD